MKIPVSHSRWVAALMLLSLMQCVGLHWAGLFAVSKTVQSYQTAQARGLMAAIKQVTKGNGNCGLCQRIQAEKSSEDRQQQRQQTTLEQPQGLIFTLDGAGIAADIHFFDAGRSSTAIRAWSLRSVTPPTPPPRFA